MRLLVGIDDTDRHRMTLDLIARLKFKDLNLSLANVVPLTDAFVWMYQGQVVLNYDEVCGNLRSRGQQLLDQAEDDACARNLRAKSILMSGGKAEGLSTAADDERSDLIAVACDLKKPIDRLLSGSLAQTLALAAHQSVMIARHERRTNEPVRAVFATDHSAYANGCVDLLLSWNPMGFEHIEVLTAWSAVGHEAAVAGSKVLVDQDEVTTFVSRKVAAKTDAVAERFRTAGISASGRTVEAEINRVIHETMVETRADLLIIGARGHGFWDRPVLGSTAMHQVGAEPHSILILRQPATVAEAKRTKMRA
jgi:nucleotide-binding universal stress UspA family protein